MTTNLKWAAGPAAVIAVAVVGCNLLPVGDDVGGRPSPSAASTPSPSPRVTGSLYGPAAAPLPDEGRLVGGRYLIEVLGSSVELTADAPEGWQGASGALFGPRGWAEPSGVEVGFVLVEGLHSDPCQWAKPGALSTDQPEGDVPVGPAAIDLVEALQGSSAFIITEGPRAVVLGSHQGYAMVIQPPAGLNLAACDTSWVSAPYYVGFSGLDWEKLAYCCQQERLTGLTDLLIVDVHGTRVVAYIRHFGDTPDTDLDAARAIVESVEIVP